MTQLYPSQPNEFDYRLTEVSRLKGQLEAEIVTRGALYKKYKRVVNALDGLDTGATATGVILGGLGTGLLVTVIAAPIVPIILGVAAGCGLLSAGSKIANSRLRLKCLKHSKIRVLAESKLNSVACIVSKALEDAEINHDEFSLVVREVQSYYSLKSEMQVGAHKKKPGARRGNKRELDRKRTKRSQVLNTPEVRRWQLKITIEKIINREDNYETLYPTAPCL